MNIDSPTDFMIGKYISAFELKQYINVPLKIKAGVFILCMKGYTRVTINMSEYTIPQLNVTTLVPNSYIQVHEISDDLLLYFIAFSSDFISHINLIKSTMNCLSTMYRNPVLPISQNVGNLMVSIYDLLLPSIAYPGLMSNREMIKAVFTMCNQGIIELYTNNILLQKQEINRFIEIYQDFMNLALKHYTVEHSVSFYADKLGLTHSYFSTSIKKAIGRSPLEVITQMLLTDAKAQLRGTSREIKNIAIDLGFNNLSFFNKFFRQHVGMTPQEYRGKLYTYSTNQK